MVVGFQGEFRNIHAFSLEVSHPVCVRVGIVYREVEND